MPFPSPNTAAIEDDLESGSQNANDQPRSSIPSFLFIIFMLWLLTSHNGEEFLARHQYQDALTSLKYQRANFTAWVNGTESNFSMPDPDPTLGALVPHFLNFTGAPPTHLFSYYQNVTAFIHGDSVFHNITPPYLTTDNNVTSSNTPWLNDAERFMGYPNATNMTQVLEMLGTWNWTASDKVAFSFVEKKEEGVRLGEERSDPVLVHGRIEFTDGLLSQDLRLDFEGVHFISNGTIYGFAEPTGLRRLDIRELPALVPPHLTNLTIKLIEPELTQRIKRVETYIDDGNTEPENPLDETEKTQCPFIFFGQILPSNIPEYYMKEMEEELLHPTGISMSPMPQLSMDGALFSKECGIAFQVKDTEGLRSRAFFRKMTNYAGMVGFSSLVLFLLFNRQIKHSQTPAGISRVSRWTFFSQAVIDCLSFAGHITFAILAENKPGLALIVPAFLSAALFMREAQFAMLVGEFQSPEDGASTTRPAQQAATPPAQTATTPASTETDTANNTYPPPPPPTTAPATGTTNPTTGQNAPPISPSFWVFFWQHVRRDSQARLWLFIFLIFTVMLRVILTPTLALLFISITYSCFWLPQIVRSVRKGRSSGLQKEYVIGSTICRLSLFLYFFACPKNVLDVTPRPWSYFLACFVMLEALVVVLQDIFGPRFFMIGQYGTEKIYDYHPPMPMAADAESGEQNLGDCGICMDSIKLKKRRKSIDEKADGFNPSERRHTRTKSAANAGLRWFGRAREVRDRKTYSLAPCHHLFHTDCLEKWLAIKNICPQCRRPLPPL